MGDLIEGRFKVASEKQRREPIIASWMGFVWLALFIALNFALSAWWRFAYAWAVALPVARQIGTRRRPLSLQP